MCGRYALERIDALQLRFDLPEPPPAELTAHYNVAPGQTMPVVVAAGDRRALKSMRWGLIPSWAKDPRIGYRTINARAEGLADKPSFRAPFRRQRCLVPASGFYEWRKDDGRKVPYFIHRQDGDLVALAGLWDRWRDPAGQEVESYTIITTGPNAVVAPLHDRMPVILEREHEEAWLDPAQHDPHLLALFLKPYAAEPMEAYPVSPAINTVRNNGAELILPLNSA